MNEQSVETDDGERRSTRRGYHGKVTVWKGGRGSTIFLMTMLCTACGWPAPANTLPLSVPLKSGLDRAVDDMYEMSQRRRE